MAAATPTNLNALQCVAAQYDFAIMGGAISTIDLRINLPKDAIILSGMIEVLTAPTSGGAAEISVGVNTVADLHAAAAISGAPWSSTGRKVMIPDFATPADGVKVTADAALTMSISVAALTAGKFNVFLFYVRNANQ